MVHPHSRLISLAVSLLLLFLLTACGPFSSAASGPTSPASTVGGSATSTTGGASATSTTAPMPPTQTACPPAGTARATVFAPLVLGPHQNIVYIFNQGSSNGEIKRYDVSTGQKVVIAAFPKNSIGEAQISADGQWVLFSTDDAQGAEVALHLVRMDGQGLQTLYCSPNGIGNIHWSPDQKTVVFTDGNVVDLLDLASGHLWEELSPASTTDSIGRWPATWLDNTHFYTTSDPNGPGQRGAAGDSQENLYALDTTKGGFQDGNTLIRVFDYSGFCLSFASSIDAAKLFVSTCRVVSAMSANIQQGPSTILAEPALGGTPTVVYSTPTLAITMVRVITRTTMLLLVQNLSGDTSNNGLWKMNLDGTGLTRLTTSGAGQWSVLNGTSQFPWSNASRDGNLYAIKVGSNNETTLQVGSLTGGSPSTFASVSNTVGAVYIVGWTTM
ncbi:MAG TPA: hypothetical protein VKR83_05975 [Ktedonobacteraceae bacterium]|nr:hypothetical protein [Ktedonobacteraceae bacterium]